MLARLRRARARPALRPPVRLPAGRRHAQAAQPAARRPPAGGRRRRARGRDARLRARRARCAPRARSASAATRRPRWPSARSSSPTASPPTCSASAWTTSPAGGRLRLPPGPGGAAIDPGREEAVAALAAILRRPSRLPVVVAGPDAEALLAKATGRPLVVAHARDADDADVMAEAALISALEGRPLVFEGLEDIEPERPARLLRALGRRAERAVVCAPNRNAALALGERTTLRRRGVRADLRRAPRRLGARLRRRATRATWRRSSASPSARSSRPPRSPALAAAGRGAEVPGPADLDLGARQASSSPAGRARRPHPARLRLGRPRRAGASRASCYVHQRLPAPPRPRAVRLGLREDGRAHAGAQGAVRRRLRHGQDDGRPGARRRARAGDLPRRPRHRRLQVHRGDGEEPRPHLRRRGGLQRDPVLRRGRRAVRQALGGRRLARPLREHRGRLPAAEDGGLSRAPSSSPRTSAATSTTRSCGGSTS